LFSHYFYANHLWLWDTWRKRQSCRYEGTHEDTTPCVAFICGCCHHLRTCHRPDLFITAVTDLFSPDEAKKAGLSKLTPDEINALNAAIFRVMVLMNTTKHPASGSSTDAEDGDVDFFDSQGRAVAYIAEDSDLTIYLWSGKPVAYLDEDSVYGFNGKHLGWLKGGAIYDHDGNLVAAIADRFAQPVTAPPVKAFKQFRPFKAFKEFKPFKPFFGSSWSDAPARIFFLAGT
jgi:hypothetical protein